MIESDHTYGGEGARITSNTNCRARRERAVTRMAKYLRRRDSSEDRRKSNAYF
jgi:hypothetical protein